MFNLSSLCLDILKSNALFCVFSSFFRDIHPLGLPHAYTIIMMFRLLPDTPKEAFDIWQVSSKDHKPETGVTLDRKYRTLFLSCAACVKAEKSSKEMCDVEQLCLTASYLIADREEFVM